MVSDSSFTQTATNLPTDVAAQEQSRLDQAIRRADDLLVSSLKTDERRRNRRKIVWLSLGGLIMLTAVLYLLFAWPGGNQPAVADPGKSEQIAQQGWILFSGGQYAQAIDKFEQAIKLNDKNPYAWNGLGWSQLNLGNTAKAEESLKKAVAILPKFPGAQTGLGQIYLEQRKYDLAKKYFEQAAKSPDATTAFSGLARISLLSGQFENAEKWAKKLIEAEGASETARAMLKAAQEKKLSDELRQQIEPPATEPSPDAAPESKAPEAGKQSNEAAEWKARLAELKSQGWRPAFALGQQLAQLPPDEGFAILKANWKKIDNVDARQQLLKAFDFALAAAPSKSDKSRLIDVLNLGMHDPSPNVQQWAIMYLTPIAFQDFGEDFSAYENWYAKNRGKSLSQVVADSAAELVAEANAQENSSQKWAAFFTNHPNLGSSFRDVPLARQGAIDAGLPALLERWIEAGAKPDASQSDRKLAAQAISMFGYLKLDEKELRRVITPLVGSSMPTEIRGAAIHTLEGKNNRWAMPMILQILTDCVAQPHDKLSAPSIIWPAASTLASMDDPKAIPTMIAVIDADNTYDTVYGVGYFGLGGLTGVTYDDPHDGKWWRGWWEKNKQRFPTDVQSIEIPKIEKRSE